jgi:acyl dehydratase
MARSVKVGDTFNLSKGPVTTVQLVMYAGASGDFNRIHYDLPFAQEAGLGGVIAHGMLTMGFAAQAVTDWAGAGALVRDIGARFLTPVRPGDVVRLEGKVESIATEGDRTVASLAFEGHTESGRVIAGTAVAVLPP